MGENGWSILLSWSNLLSPGVLCNLKEKCLFLFSKSLTLLLWKLFCLNVNIFHFQKSGQLCDSWEQYWTMRPLRRTTQSQKKNTRCLSNIALLNNVVMDPNCAHLHLHTIFPASDALPWRDTFSTQYSVQVALKKNSIPKSVKLITCMVSS